MNVKSGIERKDDSLTPSEKRFVREELEELSTRKNNLSQVIEFGRARYDRAVNKATNGRKRLGYR